MVATSQENLGEIVVLKKDREFSRMRDRFPIEVHLEPSDIKEVASNAFSPRIPTPNRFFARRTNRTGAPWKPTPG